MASLKASVIRDLIESFAQEAASGAGLNLARTAKNTYRNAGADAAAALLARASTYKKFGGELDPVEVVALKRLFDPKSLGVTPMGLDMYTAAAEASITTPLVLNAKNFPSRRAAEGFVPLTGQNINKPGLTLRDFTGKTRDRFIDEGATNLIAAINLDPAAAQRYKTFYKRANAGQLESGIPMDRVTGAWGVLSAKAEPEWNAELLRRVLVDPTGATTSQRDQMLALKFLAGNVDEALAELGKGKRFNFTMNTLMPDDPRFFTGDTRFAQNTQGIFNTYNRAPFAGLFAPHERRYGEIYIQPGLEAARRLAWLPGETQAGAWGNWRNLAGIPTDLAADLFDPIKNFEYDAEIYRRALEEVANMDPTLWQKALDARKAADKAAGIR